MHLGLIFAAGALVLVPSTLGIFLESDPDQIPLERKFPDYLSWWYSMMVIASLFAIGSFMGWLRHLPVDPQVVLTGGFLDELEPTCVIYDRRDSCYTKHESACNYLWSQSSVLFLCVEDSTPRSIICLCAKCFRFL